MSTLRWASLLLLLGLTSTFAYSDKGVIQTDDLTFSKVVGGYSGDVLVRFDKEYPWGDEHDAFKQAAQRIGESSAGVLVVTHPTSLTGIDKKGVEQAEKYGISESDFPVYKLFKRGNKGTPVDYKGDKKQGESLVQWVATETGAFFGLKGQLKEFDALARKLGSAKDEKARGELLKQAQGLLGKAAEGDKAYAEYYVKVFEKAVARPDYPATESGRIKKLADSTGVSAEKKAAFQVKLNTLSSFTAPNTASA